MKFLLAAVNAKYIHSNLGIYSLKTYAESRGIGGAVEIELAEYTINHQPEQVLQDIYRRRPSAVGFSCYIWNISFIRQLIADLALVLPDTEIWLGGPEVSFECEALLKDLPMVRGIMKGEGEETFYRLLAAYSLTATSAPLGASASFAASALTARSGPLGASAPTATSAPPEAGAPSAVSVQPASSAPTAPSGPLGASAPTATSAPPEAGAPSAVSLPPAPRASTSSSAPPEASTPLQHLPTPDAALSAIPGLAFRRLDGSICETRPSPAADMGSFPFSYKQLGVENLEHRIIYYESSRGCPFSCSYCLSSVDKALRFRPLSLVERELDWFLEKKVPQVKFVDRTFNCKKSHALAIWRHILEHDNGVTNFHFEIAADLLDEEELKLLQQMRPGLVQLEIGVQSTNPETLSEIRRRTDIDEIRRITARINSWHNIHQHLDLIAGLPYEGLERFRQSFNEVYGMEPEQLQLGFLKVLKGSHMAKMAETYGLVYSARPPYEVLSTKWLTYGELLELKGVEEMVEIHYNSRQFVHTLALLQREFSTPYQMFLHMARFYREQGYTGLNHSRVARYEILWKMICALTGDGERRETYRDALVFDLYLRENSKSRPEFARDQSPFKERVREFFRAEAEAPRYLKGYQGCNGRQLQRMTHMEGMGDGTLVLFDYRDRDPLDYNAKTYRLEPQAEINH